MHRSNPPLNASPSASLDRDGVINFDSSYVHNWSEFCFLPGVVGTLRGRQSVGYQLIVNANQSGIARSMYSKAVYLALTACLDRSLHSGYGTAHIYHWPHHPDARLLEYRVDYNCASRAPG
jgi:D-glycero-D-manno-heptose 1,7-bisphosphate phosphatase